MSPMSLPVSSGRVCTRTRFPPCWCERICIGTSCPYSTADTPRGRWPATRPDRLAHQCANPTASIGWEGILRAKWVDRSWGAVSNGLGSGSFSGKWGRCEQLVFRTASRRVLWCDVARGDVFGKSVGCTVDKQSGPIGDASTLDVSSAFSSWKTFCGTRPSQTSLWVSRVAAAAKSELLSRAEEEVEEKSWRRKV